jgi:hypothetical protein
MRDELRSSEELGAGTIEDVALREVHDTLVLIVHETYTGEDSIFDRLEGLHRKRLGVGRTAMLHRV